MFWLNDEAYLVYDWRDSGKLWNTSASTVCGLNEVKFGHLQNKIWIVTSASSMLVPVLLPIRLHGYINHML
jgi:hypothetical protein